MKNTSHCDGCPLQGKADINEGSGPKDAKFLVVVDSPSHKPETYNRLMSQSSMNMFAKHARAERFTKDDFFFYPQVRCAHNPDEYTTKEKTLMQKACRPYLLEQIRKQKPKVIIPLGANAAKQVQGRAVKITKVRGQPVAHEEFKNTAVLPMLNPMQVVMYPQHEPTFAADFATLGRLTDNDYDVQATGEVMTGDYEFIDDLEFLIKEKPNIIGFDTENTGLRWYEHGAKILTMQFCIEPGKAFLLPWDHPDAPQTSRAKARLKKQLRQLLCRPKTDVVGQNLSYDAAWVYAQTGIRFRVGGDTLMLATIVDENSTSKSLDDLVKRYVPEMSGYSDFFDSRVDKSKMIEVPLDNKFLQYACLSYESLVQLGDGSWEKIGVLVRDGYRGCVMSVTPDGRLVSSKVVDTIENGVTESWFKLELQGTKRGRWGLLGPKFTEDHKILTDRGYVEVRHLVPGDRVVTADSAYSYEQEQILLGSLLGDGGYVSRNGNMSALRVSQSGRRMPYAKWKADALMPDGYSEYVFPRKGAKRVGRRYTAPYSFRDTHYAEWAAQIGKRGSKHSHLNPLTVLSQLSDLAVATWYADDGVLVGDTSCRIVCELPPEDGEALASWFSERTGEYVSYLSSNRCVAFSRAATKALHEQIHKYVHPAVQYKLIPQFRGAPLFMPDKATHRFAARLLAVHEVSPEKNTVRHKTRYCLTVRDTHNFVTQAGVVRNCGDADAVVRLHDVLYDMVAADKKLLAHYNHVTIPGLNAFTSFWLRGQYVDGNKADEFEEYMAKHVAEQREKLLAQVPKSIKRAHAEKGVKFSRAEFLRDILFYHKDGFRLKPKVFTKTTMKLDAARRVPSTSTKDHLPYFYDTCPFTFELAEHIKSVRVLETNVRGFRNKYVVDGKVRPTFNLHTAVTGRSASNDPNGQNVIKRGPVASKYREMYIAPEGHTIISCDLSQAELRIAADMANDKTMLDIYRSKGDIHTATALIVMGISMAEFHKLPKDEQKLARFKAKAVNFGLIYGLAWRGLIRYAKTSYGVDFSDKEAQRIRNAYFAKYSGLLPWHERTKEFAHQHKYVRSYTGRIRHLPMIDSPDEAIRAEAERQGINSPVQGFGSDLGVMACGRIEEDIDPKYLELVGFVHDALYAHVPDKYLEWGLKTMRWYMETNPLEEWFGRKMKCPIVADASFGKSLGVDYEMGEFEIPEYQEDIEVGTYDFDALWKEGDEGILLPRQRIPPNYGRRTEPAYG